MIAALGAVTLSLDSLKVASLLVLESVEADTCGVAGRMLFRIVKGVEVGQLFWIRALGYECVCLALLRKVERMRA